MGAPDYPWAAGARAAQKARAGFEAAGTVPDTASLEAATMLELDRTPEAPPGVWTDQRCGVAGSVMVGTLLDALYSCLSETSANFPSEKAVLARERN